MDRRPLKTRGATWAKLFAKGIANTGITPNQISILSILMALLALVCFFYSKENTFLLILAAVFIQLRLVCNLIDGMVAIEYNKKSPVGDIYNDAPDRFADILIIMGAAFAVTYMPYAFHIAWFASVFAVMTAYVRLLGSSVGTPSYFMGPMAKPHRMFALTLGSLLECGALYFGSDYSPLYIALIIVAVGSFFTTLRRLIKIINYKKQAH